MIVLSDIGDDKLANDFQAHLGRSNWRQLSAAISTLDQFASQIASTKPTTTIFVVGASLNRLTTAIVWLRSLCPNPLIAVSNGGSVRQIVQLIRVGANDIIDLEVCLDAQLQAIFSEPLEPNCIWTAETAAIPALRKSEMRVAALLSGELTENEIAMQLNLSYFTVRNHIKKIYRKYNVHSRLQFINTFRASAIGAAPFKSRPITRPLSLSEKTSKSV